jgi:hypothetical protein
MATYQFSHHWGDSCTEVWFSTSMSDDKCPRCGRRTSKREEIKK